MTDEFDIVWTVEVKVTNRSGRNIRYYFATKEDAAEFVEKTPARFRPNLSSIEILDPATAINQLMSIVEKKELKNVAE